MLGTMVKKTAFLSVVMAIAFVGLCAWFASPAFADNDDLAAGEVASSGAAAATDSDKGQDKDKAATDDSASGGAAKADDKASGEAAKADEEAKAEEKPADDVKRVDILRLYNEWSGEHVYTTSETERDSLVKAGWAYEGAAWQEPEKSKKPVYRVYNPNAGDHHYTLYKSEVDSLVAQEWKSEGVVWYSDEAEGQALYRLYNPYAESGAHHFTSSASEIISLVARGWVLEGVAWYGLVPEVAPEPAPAIDPATLTYSPVYRLYFAVRDKHIFTAWKDERNELASGLWHYEGAAWQSPSDGDPVYRLYNPYTDEYMFTTDYQESGSLVRNGWTFEGTGFYSCVEADKDRVPIYRLCDGASGKHHFTIAEGERDALLGQGWSDEGIAFYAHPLDKDFVDDMELWYPRISGDAGFDVQLEEIIYYHAGDIGSAFNYVVDFSYRSGDRYWSGPAVLDDETTKEMAQDMIENHSGNCYRFAALFSWLARGLGYDTNVISGWVPSAGGGAAPHGWVEVYIDGETYICDPDLQHEIGGDWYMRTYSNPPTSYGTW